MLEFPRWKYLVILVVLAISALFRPPNIYQNDYAVQITGSRGAALDQALADRVSAQLSTAGVTPKSVGVEGDNLMVRLDDADAQTLAADALRGSLGEDYTVALNLDPK